jgi:hypothetical protein
MNRIHANGLWPAPAEKYRAAEIPIWKFEGVSHGSMGDVFFGNRNSIANYQIEGCSKEEAEKILPELLKAQSFAQANATANLKTPDNKRFFGAVLEFEDGQRFLSGNYILLRERPRCDIDNAITLGVNQWREQNWKSDKPLAMPKVKALYLANADSHNVASPCEDCLGLLNTPIFTPDTQIFTLEGNQARPNSLVRKQTVANMLPLHQGRAESINWLTKRPVSELPVTQSEAASAVLAQMKDPLSPKKIRHLVAQAKKSYEQSQKTDPITQMHAGSAVSIHTTRRHSHTGARFEWARRWPEFADLNAAKNGIQKAQKRQLVFQQLSEQAWVPDFVKNAVQQHKMPYIEAVAYYNDTPPSIRSLGRLRRHRGSDDTLVITVENDTIQVRTMLDYMPEVHKTPLLLKNHK